MDIEPDHGPELGILQDQLEKELQEWNTIAQKRLSAAREARKRAEADAQLLANRIALLKEEDDKAWKKIEDTRKRTREVIETRQQKENQMRAKEAYRLSLQEEENERRRRNEELRALAQAKKADAREALKAAKSSAAQQKRLEATAGQLFLDQQFLDEAERRKESASKIRLQKSERLARSESPVCRSLQNELDARLCSRRISQTPQHSLENEEKDLLRRLRFSAAAARPPRPQLENGHAGQDTQQRTSGRERVRCAALASARGRFEAEPPLKLLDFQSASSLSAADP
mmetsp:Transcript_88268/g.156277  ORF Transcript_88268/g.156277 Transcript_88268/m.156277 type:complete len:287 (+) Transcript_88268:39-899(+)